MRGVVETLVKVAVDVDVDVLGDAGGAVAQESGDLFEAQSSLLRAQVANECRRLWKVHAGFLTPNPSDGSSGQRRGVRWENRGTTGRRRDEEESGSGLDRAVGVRAESARVPYRPIDGARVPAPLPKLTGQHPCPRAQSHVKVDEVRGLAGEGGMEGAAPSARSEVVVAKTTALRSARRGTARG